MKTYVEYCKHFLKKNLKSNRGNRVCLYEFPYIIMELPWAYKSITHDREKALNMLNAWEEDTISYCKRIKWNNDIDLFPERLQVLMVAYGIRQIWNRVVRNLDIKKETYYNVDKDVIKGICIEIDLVKYIDMKDEN